MMAFKVRSKMVSDIPENFKNKYEEGGLECNDGEVSSQSHCMVCPAWVSVEKGWISPTSWTWWYSSGRCWMRGPSWRPKMSWGQHCTTPVRYDSEGAHKFVYTYLLM